MHVKHIKFENFSGYLNNMYYYSGYGGMVWNDMYEVQSAFINQHNWCDTGYNNVLSGQGEAITLGSGGFESADLYRTFNLESGTFASAWESKQPVYINSYVYTPGQGLTLKASDEVLLGQDAKTLNFARFGSDFKNIAAVNFVSGVGQGGNTCSYGTPTYGYILAMDNLSVKWNGNGGGKGHAAPRASLPHHVMQHNMPHVGANFSPLSTHEGHDTAGLPVNHAGGVNDAPYHSQLFSLPGHDSAGLTGQFALPQAEHFGT
ncbi:MAG TPA: hypothetical protein VHY79_16800 [Rhizomicrobium sp.]|jgi:hypothetical protein|nr:hypothetical protein [Rhizomicrobium sp.]